MASEWLRWGRPRRGLLESAAEVIDGELTFKTDWQETDMFIQPAISLKWWIV